MVIVIVVAISYIFLTIFQVTHDTVHLFLLSRLRRLFQFLEITLEPTGQILRLFSFDNLLLVDLLLCLKLDLVQSLKLRCISLKLLLYDRVIARARRL